MGISILDAIKAGEWDYEPDDVPSRKFISTAARPGSKEKLAVMAARVAQGLPLWNELDLQARDSLEDDA